MNIRSTLLALGAFAVSASSSAGDAAEVTARIQLQGECEEFVSAILLLGESQRLAIDDQYSIDLIHGRDSGGSITYEYRLHQREAGSFAVRHVAIRELPNHTSEPIVFLVTGKSVLVIPDLVEGLPKCSAEA